MCDIKALPRKLEIQLLVRGSQELATSTDSFVAEVSIRHRKGFCAHSPIRHVDHLFASFATGVELTTVPAKVKNGDGHVHVLAAS